MCGFVAVLTPNNSFDEELLTKMRDRLIHRGPDDSGNVIRTYERGTVALAHRRLSILDLRHIASQPMLSQGRKKIIVFNGEIYNFKEIRSELEHYGHIFQTESDTEVLLQSFERWGHECVRRLNGMFAFLIWDEEKQKAFVARDRFGEKPLYFARTSDGSITFASEVKALLANPDIVCEPDIRNVDDMMNSKILHATSKTMFKGVERFLPAHSAWVDMHGNIENYVRYWTPDYEDVNTGINENDAISQFSTLLKDSVIKRTRADVAGAACLSGGLDSSSLVGLMMESGSRDGFVLDKAFSARFPDDPTIDEGQYIDMVLKRTGLSGESVKVSPLDLLNDITRFHWHHEEKHTVNIDVPGMVCDAQRFRAQV